MTILLPIVAVLGAGDLIVVHVDARAAPGGDGSNWLSPFDTLQDAFDFAAGWPGASIEIRVARGRYEPIDQNGFQVVGASHPRFVVEGGYFGIDGDGQRDPDVYLTSLNADLNDDDWRDEYSDNAHRLIHFDGTFDEVVVDGVRLSDTYGNGAAALECAGASSMTVRDCHFTRCQGETFDAVVRVRDVSLAIGDCSFTFNDTGTMIDVIGSEPVVAVGLDVLDNAGNGIRNIGESDLSVIECRFERNIDPHPGGAIFMHHGEVLRSTFIGNESPRGGAVWQEGDVRYEDCTFVDNIGRQRGGAIGTYAGRIELRRVHLEGNSAFAGSAIQAGTALDASSCVFSNHDGESIGLGEGAILVEGTAALRNCTIIGDEPDAVHPAINMRGTTLTIANSIIWDRRGSPAPIIVHQTGRTTITSSLIRDGEAGIDLRGGTVAFLGTILDVEPFLGPDLRPLAMSPCVDAGSNALTSAEFDTSGMPRVVDGNRDDEAIVDLGGLEFQTDCLVDLNGDDHLDLFDVLVFISQFSLRTPLGDWNLDGVHTVFDVLDYLADFDSGC